MDTIEIAGVIAFAIGILAIVISLLIAAIDAAKTARHAASLSERPAVRSISGIAAGMNAALARVPDIEAAAGRLAGAARQAERAVASAAVVAADVRVAADAVEELLATFVPSMRGRFAD